MIMGSNVQRKYYDMQKKYLLKKIKNVIFV